MNSKSILVMIAVIVLVVGSLWQFGMLQSCEMVEAMSPVEIAQRNYEGEQQQLVQMKAKRNQKMDALFNQYNQLGNPTAEVAPPPQQVSAKPLTEQEQLEKDVEEMVASVTETVSSVVDEAARARVENICLAIGNGERPMILLPSFRKLFAEESVGPVCFEVVALDRSIETQGARVEAAKRKVTEEEAKAAGY